MKTKLPLILTLLLIFGSASLAAQTTASVTSYRLSDRFLVGGEGGWDYLSFEAGTGRLFITRGTHVMVLDASTGKILGDIPDTSGVHGVALATDLGIGATSNGRSNTVTLFDLKTLKKTAELKSGNKPDAILYDSASHHVFAMNGVSHDATVIDPAKTVVITTIPLDGAPEFAATDQRGHIFVNLEDKNEIVRIDSQKNTVLAHWPLAGCDSPTGLAIDAENNRLFSVCANQIMTVLDAVSGKLVATVPIGKHPDAAAFDPATKLAFSSNGEGTLTVVREDSPDKFTVVQTLTTEPGARTMALDPESHRIYLVTAKSGATPPPTAEQPHPRPAMTPGSFEVLVVAK